MENFEFKEATPMEEAKVENKVITRDEADINDYEYEEE